MREMFFIVGPTAVGKSELAADVALPLGAEVVSADAFQVYRGLDVLTAKPDTAILAKVRHHLIGTVPLEQEMNAEKFRTDALGAISEIRSRGRRAIAVGGSGLYVKALTHGLSALPASNQKLRDELNELSLDQLRARLHELDPGAARAIDLKNRRRLVRAIEICVLTGRPVTTQRTQVAAGTAATAAGSPDWPGIFVFRDREDLYQRIDRRVEEMFAHGVVDEVRALKTVGSTAAKTIGLAQIRQLINGEISQAECVTAIQQATRRYAKRQLTWFRRQTNFESLNLSLLSHDEAVEGISQGAARSFANRDV